MGNLRQELNDKAVVFADPIQVEPDDSAAVACAVDVQQLFPARKKACVDTDGFQIFEAFRVAIASENPELSVLYADSQRYAAVALIRGVQRSIGVVCESVQRVQIFDLAGNINILRMTTAASGPLNASGSIKIYAGMIMYSRRDAPSSWSPKQCSP